MIRRKCSIRIIPVYFCLIGILFFQNIALSAVQDSPADKPKAAQYAVTKATSEIKVDGVLDDAAWNDCEVIKLSYEWMPGDNVPPPVETECLVTFDNRYFYVGFRCFDPDPSKIRAHLMDRDAMEVFIQDDHISLLIDTFNDERRGFQFRVNPFGVQADANFSELEGYEDFSWDAIWKSEAKITDWGYAVEIAIPFNQLRFPETSDVQTWGFQAGRSYPRNVRHRINSNRQDRSINCLLCQFNKIVGIQGVSSGLNLELDPTFTAVRTDTREDFPDGDIAAGKIVADPGISARWGITPNLILNATINPDFSQIEADVAQMDVNTRFALRYPEKRPFFLEGADFFLTPIEAVFTRTIADPLGGVKFTGKVGKNAFGFFGAYDQINNLLFPSNQGSFSASLDQEVTNGVFRYRRDVGENSTIGMLYTGRISDEYYNHVAGFDGFFRLSQTDTVRFQYLHSETKYSDDTAQSFGQEPYAFSGSAFMTDYFHMSRNWRYGVNYTDMVPGFRADNGYVPRVDVRTVAGNFGRVFWGEPKDWFTMLNLALNGRVTWDHEGNLTDQTVSLQGFYQGPLQSMAVMQVRHTKELYLNQYFNLDGFTLQGEMKPVNGLRFRITGTYGNAVDYSNFRKANQMLFAPFFELSLGRHINFNLSHTFQRLDLNGEDIFTANLSQVHFVFNFSVKVFVRAIVQYLDVSRNLDLYLSPAIPNTNTIFTQFLFSFKLNPQTVFFLGYSDNYFGMTGLDITQSDRTFFVKIGYAWTK
ncbi:sugar-binding protein [Acidobacteriota bacterium]